MHSLDESEIYQTTRESKYPVIFYGILEIKTLRWLSPIGRKWLEIDLQERDIAKRMHGSLKPVSSLTLAGLYGEQADGAPAAGDVFGKGKKSNLTIKVWIRGVKNMSALFLTSTSNECRFLGIHTVH